MIPHINLRPLVMRNLMALSSRCCQAQCAPRSRVRSAGRAPSSACGMARRRTRPRTRRKKSLGTDGRVRNVSVPTLTPYLPDKARATGTAIIVCSAAAATIELAVKRHGETAAAAFVPHGVAIFSLNTASGRSPKMSSRMPWPMANARCASCVPAPKSGISTRTASASSAIPRARI